MFSGRRALLAVGLDVGEGQKLVDAAHGMSGDELGQDVGEVGVGIDVVELAGSARRAQPSAGRRRRTRRTDGSCDRA